mmetsp:Transcript_38015/g.63094  ORF Transcript_38015/g.63094 Transcript_38015/m.63094 type:complete len:384 (+) Transcript_38015:24-1175(+)
MDASEILVPFHVTSHASLADQGSLTYVLALETNDAQIAAATSNFQVHAVTTENLRSMARFVGHTAAVREVHCSKQPTIIVSCSLDGSVKVWDTRQAALTSNIQDTTENDEIFSCSMSESENSIATSMVEKVKVWDLRNPSSPFRVYTESFSEDATVTKVRFSAKDRLITGSEDGLVCILDTSIADEDDALISVINTEQPIRDLGFFGDANEYVWTVTNIETLALVDLGKEEMISTFDSVRETLSEEPTKRSRSSDDSALDSLKRPRPQIDYVLGCHYDASSQRLFCLAGSSEGIVVIGHVNKREIQLCTTLKKGHTDIVRSFSWHAKRVGSEQMIVTGGEDGRLVVWSDALDGATDEMEAMDVGADNQSKTSGSKTQRKRPLS